MRKGTMPMPSVVGPADVPTVKPHALPTVRPLAPAPAATPTVGIRRGGRRTSTDPECKPLIGRRIGNFVINREIGSGGFGAVYLARHVDVDLSLQQVVKVLHSDHSHRPDMVERFRGEVRAAAALSHPGIVHVDDFGQLDTGELYIVMEYLDGCDLSTWLEGKGRLDLSEAARLLEQAADALDAAHTRGIVHRDLKPSNLFRLTDGRLKVLDFGIAKLMGDLASRELRTMTGMVMGTPAYMAPEQALQGMSHVTPLADVFALGVIAYQLVVGARPWSAATLTDHVIQVKEHRPDPRALRADLPESCAAAIIAALDPVPANRPNTAGEFARMFREGLTTRRRRRHWNLPLTAGVAAFVVGGIGVGIALENSGNESAPARSPSVDETQPFAALRLVANDHMPASNPGASTLQQPAALPPPQQPASAPATQQPMSAPATQQLASSPAQQPASSPAAQQPASSPAAQQLAPSPAARPTGRLRITSAPDVADVFIGGKFQCSTEPPCTLTLPAGPHRLMLQNSRTSDEKPARITVQAGREIRFDTKW